MNAISRSRDESSSEEYRSIIDDLTIENQKLKEKLKKYGRSTVAHLESQKLFEIKIHSLSARKRRELEELLHSFSTGLDSSSEDLSINPTGRQSKAYPLPGKNTKHKSVSSGSNSRPTDSAYASMSRSGPSHSSSTGEGHSTVQSRDTKDRRMQDFLQDIPQGLLPRTSLELTENQRKRMVVRRLEQLFTGKTGPLMGVHNHSLQQQEVSKSAARADQVSKSHYSTREGVREAHIGPPNMELDKQGFVSAQNNSKTSKSPTAQSNSFQSNFPPNKSRGSPSPEQRPTRPLDLDPDRDQIGSDNVEYIRHLGISAPQLLTEESQDAAVDADGWVYLNLLINMAQLHIINVTPDFIRSAVTELSRKLQISPDGKKLRWRGGTQGTLLSSDSGGSSVHHRSPIDSDGGDEASRKRRKVHANKSTLTGQALPRKANENSKGSVPTGAFFYKPIFNRYPHNFYGASCDGSVMSQYQYGFASREHMLGNDFPRDEGPMIFYNGVKFFSDLSGDRGNFETPLHVTSVDKDGYSSHTRDAVGCEHPQRHLLKNRTPSGSLLPFRPFKDYSKGGDLLQMPETRPQTPSVLSDDMDFEFATDLNCDSEASLAPPPSLVDLSVSGLGGVQPADHLLYKVHTRWTKDNDVTVKVSRFSTPRSTSKKIVHTIPKSSLDSFHNPGPQDNADSIIDKLHRLTARTNEPLSPLPPRPYEELPIKTENISEQFLMLDPSALPEPSSYYSMLSSTEHTGTYSDSSSFSGIAHLRDEPLERDEDLMSDNDIQVSSDNDAMDIEDGDDDDDESIDMLAYARGIDPTAVATQEQNYEREASDKSVQLGSAASQSLIPLMSPMNTEAAI